MSKIKWLTSNYFDLTIRRTKAAGNKNVDIFMLVEPDDGIDLEVSKKLSQEPFKFQTTGKGYWVTSRFIDVGSDGKVTLSLSGLGSALVKAGIHVRVTEIERETLTKIHDSALARRDTFASKVKNNEFSKDTAILVGTNLNGEDVYRSEKGERAIVNGSSFELASNAKTDEDNKRFLLNGSIVDNIISIDNDFLFKLIANEIKSLPTGKKWSASDTIKFVSLTTNQDAESADNIIHVVNELHEKYNSTILPKYNSEISADSIKAHGELKALRISTSIFSRLLPEFNDDGDEVLNYLSPMVELANNKLKASDIPLIDADQAASGEIEKTFNGLTEGESVLISFIRNENNVSEEELKIIDEIRKSGDVITAFDIKNTLSNNVNSYLRVYKFQKSKELAANPNKEQVPINLLSSTQFSETLKLVDMALSANAPLPLNRAELEEEIKSALSNTTKEVQFKPQTQFGTTPTPYVVPASLAEPQRKAMAVFIEKHGEPAEYLAEKLQLTLNDIDTLLSKVQIEHVSMAISRFEDGYGFVIGDGTGTGKTRQMAAIMRYQALNDEQIMFVTPEKTLLNNLWREIKLLKADDLITPFVATSEPIVDESGELIEFATGETSENHNKQLRDIIKKRSVIPGKYNALFATYSAFSQAAQILPVSRIPNFNPTFDKELKQPKVKGKIIGEKKARVYDKTLCFEKFCHRSDTIMVLDESHNATGKSNTRKSIDIVKSACSGKVFASATSMKNGGRTELYTEAMRVNMSPQSLTEILKSGGEPALEAFSASLTEEGGYVRAEMPSNKITIRMHTDEANSASYEAIADKYAEIMQTYLKMLAYVNKAKTISNDHVKFTLDPENFKPSAQSNVEIGLNSTGFASRFTKTNELFVSCVKAEYVANEAIDTIKAGGKALIPLELTSETNVKFIQETNNYPKFTEKDIENGLLDKWIAEEKSKDPNFRGVEANFKSVLARMFLESQSVKIDKIVDESVIQIEESIEELCKANLTSIEQAEFHALMADFESKLELFPDITASPYDTIINKVRAAGYAAKAYSGRHLEILETADGIKYFNSIGSKDQSLTREAFQNDELDCVVMGRSGWTGVEWHAIKDKPVNLILVVPPTSADLDQQLTGRINRTGQTHNPTITLTSSGLPVEQRIALQALKRMREMNATTKGNANVDSNANDVQLFTAVGIEATKRYLYNNLEALEKLGLKVEDIEARYTQGASIATAATSRIIMLKTSEAKEMFSGIELEYHSFINELYEQGIEPFGQSVMDVEATMSKAVKIAGVSNSDNPWLQPVYIAKATYSEKYSICTSKMILDDLKENEDGTTVSNLSSAGSINTLPSTQRFERFSKHLEQEADSTLKSIRQLTAKDIDLIEPKDGKLFAMREKYERATEMSKLLHGMKLGQIVRLNLSSGEQGVEGVVTQIHMHNTGGYSPTLSIAIPGKGILSASAVTVDKLNIEKTPLLFSPKSALGSKFDTADTTVDVNRVAIIGSAFPTIMAAANILRSHGHENANTIKIVNLTVHSPEKGKYVEKVALLPKDIGLMNVISGPLRLSAPQAANYIKFAGDSVRTLFTAPSAKSAGDGDLTLKVIGSEATGDRAILISGLKKSFKKLIDDEAMADFGVDPEGIAGFGGTKKSKMASILVEESQIGPCLSHLDDMGYKFFAKDYGIKFVEDFNNAVLPNNYQDWLSNCRKEALKMLSNSADNQLDLNEITSLESGEHVSQASSTAAATMTP